MNDIGEINFTLIGKYVEFSEYSKQKKAFVLYKSNCNYYLLASYHEKNANYNMTEYRGNLYSIILHYKFFNGSRETFLRKAVLHNQVVEDEYQEKL